MAPRGPRMAKCSFHTWLLPAKTVMGIFSLGIIMTFVGAILIAIGSSLGVSGILAIGCVLLGVGLFLLVLCTLIGLYAYCVWQVSDAETQTVHTFPAHMSPGIDMVDAVDWSPTYASIDKRSPNGVLRDGRSPGIFNKKHVTISPRSTEMYTSPLVSGKQSESSRSSEYSYPRSDYSSSKGSTSGKQADTKSDERHQLASFAYLKEMQTPTPYSSLSQRRPNQVQSEQVPIQVQPVYSAGRFGENGKTVPVKPYHMEQGKLSQSQLPPRRHSDDDYDNTSDMSPILVYQSYPNVKQQPQQHRQINPNYEEPPPAQPLVYPSARRPMTFEQISSSKVSIYDNIHMGFKEEVD